MNKAILVLGVVLIVAGIAYALVDSYEVMVDEGYGHWEPDPPNQTILPFTHTWVQVRPAIYETRYPNLTVGAIVALIGLVTAAISYALEDFDYSVKPEVERENASFKDD